MNEKDLASTIFAACVLAAGALAGCGSSPGDHASSGFGAGGGNASSGEGGAGGTSLGVGGATETGSSGGQGSCTADADCDDGDPCTKDSCSSDRSGEFSSGVCAHAPAAAGTTCDDGDECTQNDACTADGTCTGKPSSSCLPPPVEMCAPGCASNVSAVFPDATPLGPGDLPADCSDGFELNNPPKGAYTVLSASPNGAPARTLEVDIATYTAPDHIRISGMDAANVAYALVDTCSMKTAKYSDPTDGCTRPPEDSIRRYEVTLKPGTKSLTFDVGGACTPIYLRVRGLCDFDVSKPFFDGCGFRSVP